MTEQSVIWISAPAGSGKTTLAADYLSFLKQPCLWYQLDPRDADLSTFFYYLGRALQRARPRRRLSLPLFTPEYQGRPGLFARRYFEALYAALSSPGPGRSTLVLDDFQCIQDATFHDVLHTGLGMAPPGLRILVLSREAPPAPFALLLANNRMKIVGWRDLRFRFAESLVFFHHLPEGAHLSNATIRRIHDKTQGWAAGLRLMGETMARTSDLEIIEVLQREGMFDYFLTELFEKADPQTQEFLLKTALFPSVTALDAQALTGMASSANLLRGLAEQNFFITRHPGQETSYRYHQLFREFLLEHAVSYYPPHQHALLQRNAAAILKAGGRPDDAADLYMAGAHWENLMELAQEQAHALLTSGRQDTLLNWLEHVPDDELRARPWLVYWKALCLLSRDAQSAMQLLSQAFTGFLEQEDTLGSMLACVEMIQAVFMSLDDFTRMEPSFLWLDRAVGVDYRFESLEQEARVVMSMVLGCTFCRPDHAHRDHWIKRGQELLHTAIPNPQKISMGFHLLIFHLYMCSMADASRIHFKVKSLIAIKNLPELSRLQWLLLDAIHAHMVDPRVKRCRDSVDRGLTLAATSGIHCYDVFLLTIAAFMAINTDDRNELNRLKKRLTPLIPAAQGFDAGNYHCMLTCDKLNQGDGVGALLQAQLAFDAIPEPKPSFPTIPAYLGLAEACIEAGKWPEARFYLKQARRITIHISGYMGHVLFLFPVAYAAFRRGRDRLGQRVLGRAFARARDQGMLIALFWRPRQLTLLCNMALRFGIEVEFAWTLIHRHKLHVTHREQYPIPLEISTFGRFGILRNGKQIVATRKGILKPMALLKALIVLGLRGVPKETLENLLWPDAEGDKAAHSLKFTLHALRTFLQTPGAIMVKNRTMSINPAACRVDFEEFERACAMVESALDGNSQVNGHDLAMMCEKALSLYKGDFLARDEMDWVIAMREKQKTRCLRVLERLVQIHEQAGRQDLAGATCERALLIDPLREGFYRRLMLYALQTGRKAEAVSIFNRCSRIFRAELGVTPSASLQALLQ
ncbi:MAG: hypothetical protein EOM25_12815 [Deltaproteobacteria bacterium]|nr:hypothetical protein [Deltaproteobacteria bacterium]